MWGRRREALIKEINQRLPVNRCLTVRKGTEGEKSFLHTEFFLRHRTRELLSAKNFILSSKRQPGECVPAMSQL